MTNIPEFWKGDQFATNSLWTEIIWHAEDYGDNNIPHYLVGVKFHETFGVLPDSIKWEICTPSMISEDSTVFRARFSTTSIKEHVHVVSTLMTMRSKDRFAYSDFQVIDARHSVIGSNYPAGRAVPAIHINSIIGVGPCHGEETAIKISSLSKSGTVRITYFTISLPRVKEERRMPLFLCREDEWENHGQDRHHRTGWLHYLRSDMSNEEKRYLFEISSYFQRMRQIHYLHRSWLDQVPNSEIDHLTYPVLLETYNSDPTLDRALKTFFIQELKNKFAMRQWETYKLTATPGVHWMAMAFSDKIEHIHNLHKKWLDDQEEMCHKEHKYWSEVYAKDPFLSTNKKKMLTWTADRKFLWLCRYDCLTTAADELYNCLVAYSFSVNLS